jgi:RNA polymerase sigma-54 factor
MKEKAELLLSTHQRPILSQSLQYSLKILEMSNLDLTEHIEERLLENPFLTREYTPSTHSELLENITRGRQLKDEVFEQLSFLHMSDREREIAWTLIHNLSGNIYLDSETLMDISQEKNIDQLELLKIVNKLRKTSLSGMFTFNLQDKLKTFLENSGKYNKDYGKLIRNIDLIFSDEWSTLKKRCKLSEETLIKMMSVMTRALLSPDYFPEECVFSTSVDLTVEVRAKNTLEIAANEESIPRIQFDAPLHAESTKKCRSCADKKYVKEKSASAELLIKALNHRSSTLLKVAREVISRQRNFFVGNDQYLAPIGSKSIGDTLFLHHSTVHRTISNKLISTPRGIFEFKTLLPRKINSISDEISDYALKEYMKELIDNEPKNNPYSDNNIASLMHSKGINISRRTVAKYRAAEKIQNSSERIRIYKIKST